MRVVDSVTYGATMRQRRRALSLNQQQVADVAGVNRRVVGELERGKGGVRLEIALSVALVLGLDLTLEPRS